MRWGTKTLLKYRNVIKLKALITIAIISLWAIVGYLVKLVKL